MEDEAKAHPEFWEGAFEPGHSHEVGTITPYIRLQADQWLAFYEKNLKSNLDTLEIAYLRKTSGPSAWNKSARLWKPYARDMLALLKGGRLDEVDFWLAVSGKIVGVNTGTLVDPAFWDAVLKAR